MEKNRSLAKPEPELDELDFAIPLRTCSMGWQDFLYCHCGKTKGIDRDDPDKIQPPDRRRYDQHHRKSRPRQGRFPFLCPYRRLCAPRYTLKEAVAKKISRMPEVSFLAMTSGAYDLEVNAMCRDNEHLVEFVNELSKLRRGSSDPIPPLYFKVYKYAQPDLKLVRG